MKTANYRKLNDGSHSSSKYHKKDRTPVRAILKRTLLNTTKEVTDVRGSYQNSYGNF